MISIYRNRRVEYVESMAQDKPSLKYDESNIRSIEGIEQIRKRPTVFIGSLYAEGVYRLFTEAYANVVDEFTAGRGNTMRVNIESKEHTIRIEDNCSGIPIDKLEDVITKPFTGAKYDEGAYNFSVGLNGCGLKAVSALSDMMVVDVYRDGKWAHGEFAKGHKLKLDVVNDTTDHESGTTVLFRPDILIMLNIDMPYERYRKALEMCAYMNPGLKIYLKFDNHDECYLYPKGIISYFNDKLVNHHRLNLLSQPIEIHDVFTGDIQASDSDSQNKIRMEYDIYFTWSDTLRSEMLESYVNGLQTIQNGTHVTGFRSAVYTVVRKYMQKYNMIPKELESIDASDIRESCVAVIVVRHSNPLYSTQIKDELTNSDMQKFVNDGVTNALTSWLELNKARATEIVKCILLTAKARVAASNARKAVKASAATTTHTALISIDKYRPCHSKDPSKCELFIVEGESAGGSAKSGGDGEYQAIYMLRGVPPNVYDSQNILKYLNTEGSVIGDLVKVIGCGMGASFDISKLRFYRIILMTDADPDGSHISSLLIGFFFSFYPELILAGKVFLANPPLFRFGFNKNREFYVPNMEAYWNILDSSIIKDFDLCAIHKNKGFVINNVKFYQQYLYYLRGYFDIVDIAGKQTNILPELLEYIIIKYNDIIKSKVFRFQNYEFNVYWDKSLNCNVIEGIYNNIFHKIELTSELQDTCKQMIIKLQNVHWSNLILRHKKSGTIIGPSPYIISKTIDRVVQSSADVTRYKGLGEMRPKQLYETTMNPETRTLTQVKMTPENVERYTSKLDIFIGSNIDGRKEYYRKFL